MMKANFKNDIEYRKRQSLNGIAFLFGGGYMPTVRPVEDDEKILDIIDFLKARSKRMQFFTKAL